MTAGHQRGGPGAGVLASGPDWSASQSWARAFPGTAQQASAARRFLPALLHGSPLRDDAMVVLSELFTNAVVHTASGRPGGLVVVQVSRGRLGVRIAVTDQGSPDRPVIRGPARPATPLSRASASSWPASSPITWPGTTTYPAGPSAPSSAGLRPGTTHP